MNPKGLKGSAVLLLDSHLEWIYKHLSYNCGPVCVGGVHEKLHSAFLFPVREFQLLGYLVFGGGESRIMGRPLSEILDIYLFIRFLDFL